MALTYPGGPSVSLTAQGLTQPIGAETPTVTVGLIGSAPQGSDHCCVMSIADALNYYGNPSAASSAKSTIPRALYLMATVLNMQGAQPFNVAVMAAGKQDATVSLGTGMVITAIGAYSGSRGLNLQITVNCTGGAITSIVVTDTVLNATVGQFQAAPNGPYNLSTNAYVASAINSANDLANPNSVIQVTSVGTALPTTTSTTTFSGSTNDGAGVLATDGSIDSLLAESLGFNIDLLVPLFDVAAIQPKIATHLAACTSELQYRSAVMAPQAAATFAQVTSTGSAYIPAVSDRYNVWGVPPILIRDPVYNAQNAVDPFYFAAIMAAVQAAYPPHVTLDELQVPGVLGFLGWSDHGPYLSASDLKSLGTAGFASAYVRQRSPGVFVRDNITAGAYSLDGQTINPFWQHALRRQDDAVSRTAVTAAKGYRGSTAPGTAAMALEIQNGIDESLAQLGWLTSHSTTCVPQSGNPFNYAVTINYVPQFPTLGISITTSFSFS